MLLILMKVKILRYNGKLCDQVFIYLLTTKSKSPSISSDRN